MWKLKPIFWENSWVPSLLSRIAPISIKAITLGFVVMSKGKIDKRTRLHETIHFQQYLETLFVGFIFIYTWDYVRGCLKYKTGAEAYLNIRAEIEAYENDEDENYLRNRKRYRWLRGRR